MSRYRRRPIDLDGLREHKGLTEGHGLILAGHCSSTGRQEKVRNYVLDKPNCGIIDP